MTREYKQVLKSAICDYCNETYSAKEAKDKVREYIFLTEKYDPEERTFTEITRAIDLCVGCQSIVFNELMNVFYEKRIRDREKYNG